MIDIPDRACERYLIGKQHRNSFPIKRSKKVKQTLELVHTDICDPSEIGSFGHNKYVLTFINDFTRKNLDWLVKRKN